MQFGSEPLYDNVLPHAELAQQVLLAKQNLSSLNIPVTVSELAYGYQERGGAADVLQAVDFINIHMLPFFSQEASIGTSLAGSLVALGRVPDLSGGLANDSWPLVLTDLTWFIDNGYGKKMYLDEVRVLPK